MTDPLDLEDLPPDWDPPSEKEKTWYRHQSDHAKGWHVRRAGIDMVKRDLPPSAQEQISRMDKGWVLDREHRPFTHYQISKTAFEADKALCFAMGLHREARRQWENLRDEERAKWVNEGPRGGGLRAELWAAMMAVLKPHAG